MKNENHNRPLRRSPMPPPAGASLHARIGKTTTPETPLHILTPGFQMSPAVLEYVRQRLGFKFGKFALHIRNIELRLKDENGPKGAPLVGCSLTVQLDGAGTIVVERRSSTSRAAFDVAIDRAERAVRRALQRHQARNSSPRKNRPRL